MWWVDVLLTQLEAKLGLNKQIRLEALIEEVEGLANAEQIAVASPRLDALIFGVGDFSLSQGARVDTNFVPLGEYPGEFWNYARNKVIVAARIAGIDAIDAPYPDYKDLSGYERDARRASLLGYTGKWAIHPDQVPVANRSTHRQPTRSPVPSAISPLTAKPRPRAAAPSGSTASWSMPHTSRWPSRLWRVPH